MSKISAEFLENELTIKKIKRHRKRDEDIQKIYLEDLILNKEYKSKVKPNNLSQNNQIIFMEEVPVDLAYKIALKRYRDLEKTEKEIQKVKDEFEEWMVNGEMEKRVVCVYIKNERLCYTYARISLLYKKLMQFIYKVVSVKLNKSGLSISLYLYIVNKFNLDITDKWVEISEFIKEDVEIHEVQEKIPKSKILFSKYKTKINIKRSELEKEEVPINNNITMNMNVNGDKVTYKLGKKKFRIKDKVEYYYPMTGVFNDEYAFHIRRDTRSNMVLVKRLKEPVENTFKFRILESTIMSFFMYHLGKFLKNRRRKKINLYYEKFAGKAEEGVFDFCKKCNESETTNNYFVIDENSPDYERIKDNKFVVPKHSFKYYWLVYNSSHLISSDSPIHVNIVRSNNIYIRKALYENNFVFLQHGVTYLKAHQQNSPYGKGKEAEPAYMIVGSEKEKDVVCDMLNIYEENILNVGLPIFDTIEYEHINNETDDFITIMFTWKPYEEHLYDFRESSYYQDVVEIWNMLSRYIDKNKVCIIPHPKVFNLLMNTDMKDSVWQGPISEILKKSKLLITDYSSVAYNSFYQGSGVIFYQPDLKLYEQENGDLIPGNDEYIGERVFTIDELEDVIKETVIDGKINLDRVRTEEFKEIYKSINQFSDGKNMERLYDRLVQLKII